MMFIPLRSIRKKLSKLYVAKLRTNSIREKILIQSFIKDLKTISNDKLIKKNSLIEFEKLQALICNYYNIHPRIIRRRIKDRDVSKVRQMIMVFASNYTDLSQIKIAKKVNRKQNGSIIFAQKTFSYLYETDSQYREEADKLTKMLDNLC